MNRVMTVYDLDTDHNRLWINADLDMMPETVIVKNVREGKEQTSTFKLREVVSYEEGYADGFERGEEAIIQQIDGIVRDPHVFEDSIPEQIRILVKVFWKEREQ